MMNGDDPQSPSVAALINLHVTNRMPLPCVFVWQTEPPVGSLEEWTTFLQGSASLFERFIYYCLYYESDYSWA